MNMRMIEMSIKNRKITEVADLEKKAEFIEYPEEIKEIPQTSTQKLENLLKDKNLREKFFEGVTYEKDPTESTEE